MFSRKSFHGASPAQTSGNRRINDGRGRQDHYRASRGTAFCVCQLPELWLLYKRRLFLEKFEASGQKKLLSRCGRCKGQRKLHRTSGKPTNCGSSLARSIANDVCSNTGQNVLLVPTSKILHLPDEKVAVEEKQPSSETVVRQSEDEREQLNRLPRMKEARALEALGDVDAGNIPQVEKLNSVNLAIYAGSNKAATVCENPFNRKVKESEEVTVSHSGRDETNSRLVDVALVAITATLAVKIGGSAVRNKLKKFISEPSNMSGLGGDEVVKKLVDFLTSLSKEEPAPGKKALDKRSRGVCQQEAKPKVAPRDRGTAMAKRPAPALTADELYRRCTAQKVILSFVLCDLRIGAGRKLSFPETRQVLGKLFCVDPRCYCGLIFEESRGCYSLLVERGSLAVVLNSRPQRDAGDLVPWKFQDLAARRRALRLIGQNLEEGRADRAKRRLGRSVLEALDGGRAEAINALILPDDEAGTQTPAYQNE